MLKKAYNSAFKKFALNHACFDDLNKLSVNLSIKFLSFSKELVTELLTSIPPEIIYPSPPNPLISQNLRLWVIGFFESSDGQNIVCCLLN